MYVEYSMRICHSNAYDEDEESGLRVLEVAAAAAGIVVVVVVMQ